MLFFSLVVTALSSLSARAHSDTSLGQYLYSREEALLPSKDPFYAAPKNISRYKPGDIIRYRRPPSELGFFGRPLKIDSAWQILYRSTGVQGEPLATVITVLVPKNADHRRVLSYQSEIDAPYDGCTPSITLQTRYANVNNIASQYGELWLVNALQRGWVIALPDYQGPKAAFLVGTLAGKLVLDGIRAVLQSKSITGVERHAKAALWGYSGGSLATNFAVEQQPKYAPELKLAGAAMGGLPADVGNHIKANNKKFSAGLTIAGILGIARGYPELQPLLDQQLLPDRAAAVRQVERQCLLPTVVQFAGKDVFQNFRNGSGFFEVPRVAKILKTLKFGITGKPRAPMYIYQAINDEIVSFKDVQELVKKYCKQGATVQFIKESSGGHFVNALAGAPGALQFLADRFDGKQIQKRCSERKVLSSAIDPEALKLIETGLQIDKSDQIEDPI